MNRTNPSQAYSLSMPQQIVMGSSWNSAQIPKDPVDKNFQYTIAPSASLHEHGRGKDQKPNNTLGSNDYVKRNVKIENAVVQTSTKRKYNRKKQSPAKLLPKMTIDDTRNELKLILAQNKGKKHNSRNRKELNKKLRRSSSSKKEKKSTRSKSFKDEIAGHTLLGQFPGSKWTAESSTNDITFSYGLNASRDNTVHTPTSISKNEGKFGDLSSINLVTAMYTPPDERGTSNFFPIQNEKNSNLSLLLNGFWECSGGNSAGRIDFAMYTIIFRNILKALIGHIAPEMSRELIGNLWRRDAGNNPSMVKQQFYQALINFSRCWVGDSHIGFHDGNLAFLRQLFDDITMLDESGYRLYIDIDSVMTRDDSTIKQKERLFNYLLQSTAGSSDRFSRQSQKSNFSIQSNQLTRVSSSRSSAVNDTAVDERSHGTQDPGIKVLPWTPTYSDNPNPGSLVSRGHSALYGPRAFSSRMHDQDDYKGLFVSSVSNPHVHNIGVDNFVSLEKYHDLQQQLATSASKVSDSSTPKNKYPDIKPNNKTEEKRFLMKGLVLPPRPSPPTGKIAFIPENDYRQKKVYPEVDFEVGPDDDGDLLLKAEALFRHDIDSRHPVHLTHEEDAKRLLSRVNELLEQCGSSVPSLYKEKASIYHQLLMYLGNAACCSWHKKLLFSIGQFYNSLFSETYAAVFKETAMLREALAKSTKKAFEQSKRVKRFVNKSSEQSSSVIIKKSFHAWKEATLKKNKHNNTLNNVLNAHSKKNLLGRYFKTWHTNIEVGRKVRGAIANAQRIVDESYYARTRLDQLLEETEIMEREHAESLKKHTKDNDILQSKVDKLRDNIDEASDGMSAIENFVVGLKSTVCFNKTSAPLRQRMALLEDFLKDFVEHKATDKQEKAHLSSNNTQTDLDNNSTQTDLRMSDIENMYPINEISQPQAKSNEKPNNIEMNATVETKSLQVEVSLPLGRVAVDVVEEAVDVIEEHPHANGIDDAISDEKLGFFNFFAKNEHAGEFVHEDIEYLWNYMDIVAFQKNELIIKQGEIAAWVGLIISGALDVVVNENAVATMFAGSMVGELGLYEAKERSADCKGSKSGIIAALKYEDVERLNSENPTVAMKFATFLAGNAVEKLRERVTQLTNVAESTQANPVEKQKDDIVEDHVPRKKNWHHVRKLVSKRRSRRRKWIGAHTEVFYRSQVNRGNNEITIVEAEEAIKKSKERERREHILRKGLENTVGVMEEHIKELEAKIKNQEEQR